MELASLGHTTSVACLRKTSSNAGGHGTSFSPASSNVTSRSFALCAPSARALSGRHLKNAASRYGSWSKSYSNGSYRTRSAASKAGQNHRSVRSEAAIEPKPIIVTPEMDSAITRAPETKAYRPQYANSRRKPRGGSSGGVYRNSSNSTKGLSTNKRSLLEHGVSNLIRAKVESCELGSNQRLHFG